MKKCDWQLQFCNGHYFQTSCGNVQYFEIGDIDFEIFKYCPFCQKEITGFMGFVKRKNPKFGVTATTQEQ